VRDRVHLFVAFDRQDSSEPPFSGAVETAADEIAAGVAKDSLARLQSILRRDTAWTRRAPEIGRWIGIQWRTPSSRAWIGG